MIKKKYDLKFSCMLFKLNDNCLEVKQKLRILEGKWYFLTDSLNCQHMEMTEDNSIGSDIVAQVLRDNAYT